MLRKKALKKIFITTLTMFIILTVFTLPTTNKKNILRTNLEIEDITNLGTDTIYLLNNNDYLVKTNVFLNDKKIESIVDYLTINNNKIPYDLNGYIPKNTKLLNYNIESNSLVLNFSKEILNTNNEELMIRGLVYSLLELDNINEVSFLIEDKPYKEYHNLTKKIGINNEYIYNNRNNIDKVVIYYVDSNDYYVPVTKYLNNDNNKIEVIIEELKNTKEGLISYLNNNTKLLNYKEEDNLLILNFNSKLKEENKEIEEKLLNTISYSIFDNYNVNMVMFEVEGEYYKRIEK